VSSFVEVNFDGLVGPTHHYAGLAYGNLASTSHRHQHSSPRQAALQGLAKMKLMTDLGIRQAILPPHERPNISWLKRLGFSGTAPQIIKKAYKTAPHLLAAAYSSAAMWTANAATVSASIDSEAGKVQFTPANLISQMHRQHEAVFTSTVLKRIFFNEHHFSVHPRLPASAGLADEGAASHSRLWLPDDKPGLNIFVYGFDPLNNKAPKPSHFPARQSLLASRAVARQHDLPEQQCLFIQQNPAVIDAGVFHNDVIALANKNVLFFHQHAFVDKTPLLAAAKKRLGSELVVIEVANEDISVEQAVASYLFNSQLLDLPDGSMALIAPSECEQDPKVADYLAALCSSEDNPINTLHFVDCRQSMDNGGGPACLRLRVPLSDEQLSQCHQGVFFTEKLYQRLLAWVDKHYRDRIKADDLRDPALMVESLTALDELSQILQLGAIYPSQRAT